jgi:hypothetical protein
MYENNAYDLFFYWQVVINRSRICNKLPALWSIYFILIRLSSRKEIIRCLQLSSLRACCDFIIINQGCTTFPEKYDAPQNSRRQNGGMKQVLYWGATSIRRHLTQFSCQVDLASEICAFLLHISFQKLPNSQHSYWVNSWFQSVPQELWCIPFETWTVILLFKK